MAADTFTIRTATESDAPDLEEIQHRNWVPTVTPAGPYSPRAFFGKCRPEEVLVAVAGGRAIGYLVIRGASPLPSQAHNTPPPTTRTQGAAPLTNHDAGAPLPPHHIHSTPPLTTVAHTAPPPTADTHTAPPPAASAHTAPPPATGTHAAPTPTGRAHGAPPPTTDTRSAPPPTGRAQVASIRGLGVAETARRRGVAGALLHAGERVAVERGFTYLSLHVLSCNTAALALYARHGFETEHVAHGAFRLPVGPAGALASVDDLLLTKRLA